MLNLQDHEEVDDPGSDGTEEAQEEEEDVLSQLSKTLDMDACCGAAGEDTATVAVHAKQHTTPSNKELKTTTAAPATEGDELAAAAEATAAAAAALQAVAAAAAAATAASGDTRREVLQTSTSLLHPGWS